MSGRRPTLCILLIAVMGAAACSSSSGGGPAATPADASGALNAEVASGDLVAGDPQRFLIGVFASDGRLLSFGEVALGFSYLGTQKQPVAPAAGPGATASFLPTPGTPDARSSGATLTPPSQGRGVYQAGAVTFDRAGIWQVDVTAQVASAGTRTASASFEVAEEPQLPYPGQRARRTENLTIGAKDAPAGAIDSSAANGDPVPDPQLHRWTIADAIAQRLPVLVTFATPVYCTSRFCGPTVDEIATLERRYRDRAVFIHVEIWRDFQGRVINQAAADWLYRDDTLTEPWTYLIGSNGRILDRWGALFDPVDVSTELSKLPKVRIPPDG